jgi:hypothetical protein
MAAQADIAGRGYRYQTNCECNALESDSAILSSVRQTRFPHQGEQIFPLSGRRAAALPTNTNQCRITWRNICGTIRYGNSCHLCLVRELVLFGPAENGPYFSGAFERA